MCGGGKFRRAQARSSSTFLSDPALAVMIKIDSMIEKKVRVELALQIAISRSIVEFRESPAMQIIVHIHLLH